MDKILIEGMSMEEYLKLKEIYSKIQKERNFGLRTLMARLENLKDEARMEGDHGKFLAITSRLKSFESALGKCQKRGLPLTEESLRSLTDIAGVRIITIHKDMIRVIAGILSDQPSMSILKDDDDYVDEPKPSGYRSLHINAGMDVHLANRTLKIPVEIQLRTPGMDYWATMEHGLNYKNSDPSPEAGEIFVRLSADIARFEDESIRLRDWRQQD